MGLGGHNQSESLKRSSNVKLGSDVWTATSFYFSQIVNGSAGRNGPQDEGCVNPAEFIRAWQVIYGELDARASAAATFNFRFALQSRQQRRAAKLDHHSLLQRISNGYGAPGQIALCECRLAGDDSAHQ